MDSPKIIVLGSINTDLVIRSSNLPRAGETITGGEFYQAGGGKGANQAVAAARTSASPVVFIAAVGSDQFGRQSIKTLRKENIDTSHIRVIEEQATGVALIMVDEAGENQISVASGANAHLTPEIVHEVEDRVFESATVFVACLETPLETVVAGLRRAKQFGLTTILNPAPAIHAVRDRSILELVDVLTPNEIEAQLISGWEDLDDLEDLCIMCEQLQQKGASNVIVTRGSQAGFLCEPNGDPNLVAAHSVDAVDATAAGDCFNGALASALSREQSLLDATRFAMGAAALSVTRRGAIPSLPTLAEIEELIA